MEIEDRRQELENILDEISYELTSARTAGLGRPDALRASLRRARDLVSSADALAGAVAAAQRDASAG